MQPEPKIVHHRPRNADVVFLRDPATKKRRMVYLGVHGSEEARARFHEVMAAHAAGRLPEPRTKRRATPSSFPTVEVLCAEWTVWAEREYRDAEGNVSREVENFDAAIDHLLELHRDVPADQFTVRHLRLVRDAMLDGGRLCRNTINARVRRIKAVFRWGAEQRLVPGPVWHEVASLRALGKNRGGARETPEVEPVPWKIVEATLQHLPAPLVAAVLVQWHSGARPAEILSMTRRQLTTSGKVWLYRPVQHKGDHLGKKRVVALGPKAQEVLRPLVTLAMDAPIFAPAAVWSWFRSRKRAERRTPATKQTRERDARRRSPVKREFLDVATYRRALHRAADKAEVPRWSPHRLRHAAGTRIATTAGIEAARAALGHADDRMTRRYTHTADEDAAKAVAAKHG